MVLQFIHTSLSDLRKLHVQNPLLLMVTGYGIGIVLNEAKMMDFSIVVTLGIVFVLCLVSFILSKNNRMPSFLSLSMIYIIFILLGVVGHKNKLMSFERPLQERPDYEIIIEAKCSGENRFIAAFSDQSHSANILVILDSEIHLMIGDTLKVSKKPKEIFSRNIPNVFDFKRYNRHRNVRFQLWLVDEDFKIMRPIELIGIHGIRENISARIRNIWPNVKHRSIINAFILGDRSMLKEETVEIFRRSGAMHILAVSGLHVAMVSGLIMILLSRVHFGKNDRILKISISLLFIWSFAILTGLAASVMRASIAFSLIQIHFFDSRGALYPLNLMSAAALAILVFNPSELFNVGFQFSFFAILGIFLFAKDLFLSMRTRSWIANYFLGIICVSIAAQVFIFPLSLYYFKESSVMGVVSSLIAIPAAGVILLGSIISLAVSFFSLEFSVWFSNLSSKCIDFLIYSLKPISECPYSVFKVNAMSQWEIISICILVFLGYSAFFYYRSWSLQSIYLVLLITFSVAIHWSTEFRSQMIYKVEYSYFGQKHKELWLQRTAIAQSESPQWIKDLASTYGVLKREYISGHMTLEEFIEEGLEGVSELNLDRAVSVFSNEFVSIERLHYE